MAFIKGPLAVDRGFPSLFAQTQANLFRNTAFEASDDDFQEMPLLRKGKNIRTTLKAAKEGTSALGPSNVVINEKTSMPTINKDTSVQTVLPTPTPSTSSTSAPIKTFKKYQDKVLEKFQEIVISKNGASIYQLSNVVNYFLNQEKTSSYFCGDSLTVKQHKSLARHIFQQKINPKSVWPPTVGRIERYEAIANNFFTF
ncbi:hypothetical protein RMCBS344292_01837 [Rhizopus microsporus]|nr:hypothetical protein RMCBS344292_01837 [Rhizopus microsporus]